MSQRFSIDSGRTFDITLTVGVAGESDSSIDWPWTEIFCCLGTLACAVMIFVAAAGTPYLQTGATFCEGTGTTQHPCGAPVRCTYAGWQGRREMTFPDTDRCPFILFLPSRVDPPPPDIPDDLQRPDRTTPEQPMETIGAPRPRARFGERPQVSNMPILTGPSRC